MATNYIQYPSAGVQLTFTNSLVNNSGSISLVNDSVSPGNSEYYGTNSSGIKGFFPLPVAPASANPALSNLASVAINTSLLPGVSATIDLGSSSKLFRTLYLSGQGLGESGSVGAPAWSFTADPSSGLYFADGGAFPAMAQGGVDVVWFTASGGQMKLSAPDATRFSQTYFGFNNSNQNIGIAAFANMTLDANNGNTELGLTGSHIYVFGVPLLMDNSGSEVSLIWQVDNVADIGSSDGGTTLHRPKVAYVGSYLNLGTIAAASVPNAPSGTQSLFLDSSNSNKLSRKDSAGTVVVIG